MSSQKIKEAALQLFATRGYEGTSLADIAEVVGIKKSSIYNHYKNKDDLFIHIFETCCNDELHLRKRAIEGRNISAITTFEQFIEAVPSQVVNNLSSLFVFRFTTFPPHHFKQELGAKINDFFQKLYEIILNGISSYPEYQTTSKEQLGRLSSHYILLLKGTFVDLLNHQFNEESPLTKAAWTNFNQCNLMK